MVELQSPQMNRIFPVTLSYMVSEMALRAARHWTWHALPPGTSPRGQRNDTAERPDSPDSLFDAHELVCQNSGFGSYKNTMVDMEVRDDGHIDGEQCLSLPALRASPTAESGRKNLVHHVVARRPRKLCSATICDAVRGPHYRGTHGCSLQACCCRLHLW